MNDDLIDKYGAQVVVINALIVFGCLFGIAMILTGVWP